MKTYSCGIDIHLKDASARLVDESGKVLNEGKIPFNKEAIDRFFMGLPPNLVKVAIEACSIWRGYYKILTELGFDVTLANPLGIKEIAKNKKTDKIDAKIITDLLRLGYLPEVYIPSEDVLKIRDLARHRAGIVRMRTRVKCKIKSILMMDGIKYNNNIWSRKGMKHLRSLNVERLDQLLNIMESMNIEIKRLDAKVARISHNKRLTRILQTHPGIGTFGSLMMIGEIADIKRFETPKQVVSYAGLCPGIYQSGTKSHTVSSRVCNKWLKWTVYECSGRAVQLDERYLRHYCKVKKRKGFQTARRSVARKMLTTIWHMLTNEEPYRKSSTQSTPQLN